MDVRGTKALLALRSPGIAAVRRLVTRFPLRMLWSSQMVMKSCDRLTLHAAVKADRNGGWCRPRHRHLGASYLCHSKGCDAYKRPGFPVRSGRTRLDRFDTSSPPSHHRCSD